MAINPLSLGDKPTLDQVLLAREKRVQVQEQLVHRYEGKVLTVFKLNIPGPIKNNALIKQVFDEGLERIKRELQSQAIDMFYLKVEDDITGPQAFMITSGDGEDLKNFMVTMEEKSSLGRLYDLDVYVGAKEGIRTIAREDLKLLPRTCLMCNNLAKACGRSRAHSVEELLAKIHRLILEDQG